MSGTKEGSKKAVASIKAKYGRDYYRMIGRMGGQQTVRSGKLALVGFAADRERARIAGAKGGRASSRAGVKNRPAQYIDMSLLGKLKRLFRRRYA